LGISRDAHERLRQDELAYLGAARRALERIDPLAAIDLEPNKDVAARTILMVAPSRPDTETEGLVELAVSTLKGATFSRETRQLALTFLQKLGSEAESAVPTLLIAAREGDAELRRMAVEALEAIDPEAAKTVTR
jgi:hypothetical protein